MSELSDLAAAHQSRLTRLSDRAARRVVQLWRQVSPAELDAGWDAVAPQVGAVVAAAQVDAASSASRYAAMSLRLQGDAGPPTRVAVESFAGVTREGREVVPELFSAVGAAKSLIGRGSGVPAAFQAGAGLMSVLAATIVRDSGRMADQVASVARGSLFSIRVIQPGACSRCAILAGVKGYRTDFDRHPRCRCTSMPLRENETPEGFFTSPSDYFESLSEAEQDRVFTKSGAWAIRNGADPVKVVNARRGALKSVTRADGTVSLARLRPTTIGVRPDGSPLQVYATAEGTTARSSWARRQPNMVRNPNERYRRTSTVRLMPEQIIRMADSPDRARELLQRYGYLY